MNLSTRERCIVSAERNGDEKCNAGFVSALVSGDRRACARISDSALVEAGDFLEVYTGLFQPSMYRVGELWEYNKISVAAEHMASSITEGLMNRVAMDMEPAPAVDKSVVVGSVEGELHQIGAKMVADVFELHGWDTLYLGADTPLGELLRLLREQTPDAVALSLTVFFHMPALIKMIDAIREEFPELPILVGGQGFRHGGEKLVKGRPGVVFVPSLQLLENVLKEGQDLEAIGQE